MLSGKNKIYVMEDGLPENTLVVKRSTIDFLKGLYETKTDNDSKELPEEFWETLVLTAYNWLVDSKHLTDITEGELRSFGECVLAGLFTETTLDYGLE